MDLSRRRTRRAAGTRFVPTAIVLGGLLLALLAAPAGAAEGSVEGSVTARASGRAVAGATVTVDGTTIQSTTDAAGRFAVSGDLPETFELVVAAPGFLEARVAGVTPTDAAAVRVALEASPDVTERLQVTASKLPLSLAELPAQADLVDREQIDLRGDQKITQAIANVPGLVVSTQLGSFESVTMRGLPRDGNEFTTTLLLVDGVPQTDSRNSARVVNLTLHDASTIEVVHGPSSALYGRTAIGGAVNLLTADPTADHSATFSIGAGDWDALRGFAHVAGPMTKHLGYYLSGSFDENEGYWNGPSDYEAERDSLFGKLAWFPGAESFGRLSFDRVRADHSTPTSVPVIDGELLYDIDPLFDRFTNLNLPGPNYHQEEDRLTAHYTHSFTDALSLVALLGFREVQYKFIDDGDLVGSPFDVDSRTLTMYPFDQQVDEDISYSELRTEIVPDGKRHSSLIAGISYENTSGFGLGNLIYTDEDTFGMPIHWLDGIPPPRELWQFELFGGNDYDLESTGIFAQYRIEPAERWSFVAAARYDAFDIENILTLRPGQPHVDDSFDELSPKLSVIYDLPALGGLDLNLYASYAEAFLPPRRPSDLRPATTPIELEPEDVENLELGVHGSAASGKVSLQAALFDMDRTGIIATTRQGPFFLPSNAGEHEYEGFEAAVRFVPMSRFSAYLNAALYHNRFGDFVIESAGGDTVLTGNRLPISPDQIWNAGLALTPLGPIDIALDVKYVGDVVVDQRNTLELDPYTLVDAAVTWRHDWLALTLSAHNLLDEEYFGTGDSSTAETVDVGAPSQVLLTARIDLRRR